MCDSWQRPFVLQFNMSVKNPKSAKKVKLIFENSDDQQLLQTQATRVQKQNNKQQNTIIPFLQRLLTWCELGLSNESFFNWD